MILLGVGVALILSSCILAKIFKEKDIQALKFIVVWSFIIGIFLWIFGLSMLLTSNNK